MGDRLGNLSQALKSLKQDFEITLLSSVYESDAMLPPNAPAEWDRPYFNLVAAGKTSLEPPVLLRRCKELEERLGRNKDHAHWSPRVMDIDMLAYGIRRMQTPALTLPHSGIAERAFVLQPL